MRVISRHSNLRSLWRVSRPRFLRRTPSNTCRLHRANLTPDVKIIIHVWPSSGSDTGSFIVDLVEKIDRSDTSWSRRVPSRRWWKPPARFRVSSVPSFSLSLSPPPLLDNLSRTVSIISGPVDFVSFRIWRKIETEGRNSSLDRVAYVDEQRRWKRKEEKGRLLIRESTRSFAIIDPSFEWHW